jgi:hypothetical protein
MTPLPAISSAVLSRHSRSATCCSQAPVSTFVFYCISWRHIFPPNAKHCKCKHSVASKCVTFNTDVHKTNQLTRGFQADKNTIAGMEVRH